MDNSFAVKIESIRNDVFSSGRNGVSVWFHPRACRIPDPEGFFKAQPKRVPAYAVRRNGAWENNAVLEWPGSEDLLLHTTGCAQCHTFEDGKILIPFCLQLAGREDRVVTTALCSFDGDHLAIKKYGKQMERPVGRGLLEPTLIMRNGSFFLSIRAEDGYGYVSRSGDGLIWEPIRPWQWDDGEPLAMSTTRQRWMKHSDRLYLVYTRWDSSNCNVMRWRAPLFIAPFDEERMCLLREEERIAVPLDGDGVNDGEHVARLGNFHTVTVSEFESWITVGEARPLDGWKGDTIISRIRWDRSNRL